MEQPEKILSLFKANREFAGVVHAADIDKYATYVEENAEVVIGAALAEHQFADHTLVHAVAVAETHRGEGVGTRLLQQVAAGTPHDVLRTKCRKGIPANEFFESLGWSRERETGDGKMNVWRTDI